MTDTGALVVIPARYGSTRYPGKPLVEIGGVPMIQRVWALAKAASGVSDVVVATDDQRIVNAVEGFGGRALMTPETCRNGTERAHAALGQMCEEGAPDPLCVINLQGDAVLTPPWIIGALAVVMAHMRHVQISTPAMRMNAVQVSHLQAQKAAGEVGGTTVTFNTSGDALYFSKQIIPFLRAQTDPLPVFRHIGLYAYRREVLDRLIRLPMGTLEKTEGLEQLRALENGIPIRVVEVDYRGRSHWSVDSPEDVRRAEHIIAQEGELLTAYDGSGTAA